MVIWSSSIRLYIYIANVAIHEVAPPAVGAFAAHGDRPRPPREAAGDVPVDALIDANATSYG